MHCIRKQGLAPFPNYASVGAMHWTEIGTFFGITRKVKAPGTVGTVLSLPIWYLLAHLPTWAYMLICVLLFAVGMFICETYEKIHGGHDHSELVFDELVGFLITMTWVPISWQSAVFGFVIFRLLDIWKPLIIGMADRRITGGLGVMADDAIAGIIGNIILQVIFTNTLWLGSQLVLTN